MIPDKTPRRSRLDLNTPAELSITNAMYEVEKLPPDVRLTDVINLLHKAKGLLSDYVDEKLAKEYKKFSNGIECAVVDESLVINNKNSPHATQRTSK